MPSMVLSRDPPSRSPLATVLAATSALATSGPPTVTELAGMPIAMRSQGGLALVSERLVKAYFSALPRGVAASPSAPASQAYAPLFARGIVADALHELALFTGDEAAAATWRGRAGCAREAAVVGPLDATPLRSLTGPSPVANGPFPGTFSGNTPFARGLSPVRVKASGCVLSLTSTGALQGTRLVVVDLDSARAQTVGLALTSFSAALLDVGGLSVLSRGFEAGGDPVTRLAAVAVPAGKTRVVVRIANKGEDADLALSAWGEDGGPVPLVAPAAGDTAPGVPSAAKAIVLEDALAADASAAQLAAVSLGLMALGEGRDAEHLLEARVNKATRTPTLALLSARAIELADDLPDAKQAAASRVLLDELRSRAPEAWEGALLHARATELQKGSGEGPMRALSELGVLAPAGSAPSIDSPEMPEKEPYSAEAPRPAPSAPDAMTLAFVALLSDRSKLSDVARVAYESLAESAPGAPLLAHVDALLFQRAGQEARAALCHGGLDRSSTNCLHTHAALGDHPAFVSELARLRRLHGSPDHLRVTELDELVRIGELDAALALYDALPPGERQLLSVPAALAAKPSGRAAAKERLLRDRTTSRDAPYGLPGLSWLTRLRPDPALAFEAEGRALVQKDRAQPFLPGAAVAVLRRVESYDLDASGLLHWVVYDLRRVTGTTDVEQGAQSFGPNVEGRTAQRLLRRRIHKRDGRILEPDAAANAAQQSDLSQLEQGDYVEQISEGWALPGGHRADPARHARPLPERTSVREATIELAPPEALPLALWSHPLLGKADGAASRGQATRSAPGTSQRGAASHRDGVPKMERAARSAPARRPGRRWRAPSKRTPAPTKSAIPTSPAGSTRSSAPREISQRLESRRSSPPWARRSRSPAAASSATSPPSSAEARSAHRAQHPRARPGQPLVGHLPRALASSA
jgi:hypothetical protein